MGQYESETIKFSFDHGLFSDPLTNARLAQLPHYKIHTEQIDGRDATISYQKTDTEFALGVHFSKANAQTDKAAIKLTVFTWCASEADYEAVTKIFRSIKFKA